MHPPQGVPDGAPRVSVQALATWAMLVGWFSINLQYIYYCLLFPLTVWRPLPRVCGVTPVYLLRSPHFSHHPNTNVPPYHPHCPVQLVISVVTFVVSNDGQLIWQAPRSESPCKHQQNAKRASLSIVSRTVSIECPHRIVQQCILTHVDCRRTRYHNARHVGSSCGSRYDHTS